VNDLSISCYSLIVIYHLNSVISLGSFYISVKLFTKFIFVSSVFISYLMLLALCSVIVFRTIVTITQSWCSSEVFSCRVCIQFRVFAIIHGDNAHVGDVTVFVALSTALYQSSAVSLPRQFRGWCQTCQSQTSASDQISS